MGGPDYDNRKNESKNMSVKTIMRFGYTSLSIKKKEKHFLQLFYCEVFANSIPPHSWF